MQSNPPNPENSRMWQIPNNNRGPLESIQVLSRYEALSKVRQDAGQESLRTVAQQFIIHLNPGCSSIETWAVSSLLFDLQLFWHGALGLIRGQAQDDSISI